MHHAAAVAILDEQKVIRAKLDRLELARQLGNVSQPALPRDGYSRDSFYRFKVLSKKATPSSCRNCAQTLFFCY